MSERTGAGTVRVAVSGRIPGWVTVARSRLAVGFGAGAMVPRTAVAAGLAWWIATAVLHSDAPAVAPAGAILAAQTTPFATARKSLERAAGILFGALLGLAAVSSVGAGGVSVLVVVLVGMYAGRLLRLGSQTHQIALTGVLVMGTTSTLEAGVARLEGNGVGLLLGLLLALAVPAPAFTRRAGQELARLNRELARLLDDISRRLATDDWAAHTRDWVDRARGLSRRLRTVDDAVRDATDAVRLRPRAAAQRRRCARLAEAARCLDHVGHQVRGVTRGLYNLTYRDGRPPSRDEPGREAFLLPEPAPPPAGLDAALATLAALLTELAETHQRPGPVPAELRKRLRDLHDTGRAGALSARVDWREVCAWGIAEDVSRMLHELDPRSGPHRGAFGATAG